MMKGVYIAGIAAIALVSATADAKKKPQLSGLELQQIQSKDFEVSKDVTFPAVMSVLQDSGYRIQGADRDTGLITGIASTKGNVTWVPFVGFGRSKKTPVVSAYIENRGQTFSRVRLNFVMTKLKSNGFGSAEDEEPITDATTYQDAFEKIQKAVFVRQALDAPAAAAEPVAKPLSPEATPAPAQAGKTVPLSQAVAPTKK